MKIGGNMKGYRLNKDIEYVQRWSLTTDIKICFWTIIVTLKGDKNAF